MADEHNLSQFKELTDVNLKTLEDALSKVLTRQVGGDISVRLTRFVYNGGAATALEIDFRVYDQSWTARPYQAEGSKKTIRYLS